MIPRDSWGRFTKTPNKKLKPFDLEQYQKDYYQKNKNRIRKNQKEYYLTKRKHLRDKEKDRDRKLRQRYGITLEQYQELFEKQNGCCAVCHKHQSSFKQNLHVDHDHKTGEIRGLLCNFCNRRFIGRHTDPARFESAAEYLRGPYTGWIVPKKKKKPKKTERKSSSLLLKETREEIFNE